MFDREELARKNRRRRLLEFGRLEANDDVCNKSGDEDEVGVLDEQLVIVLELGPERGPEQLGPESALELHFGMACGGRRPQVAELPQCELATRRVTAQSFPD